MSEQKPPGQSGEGGGLTVEQLTAQLAEAQRQIGRLGDELGKARAAKPAEHQALPKSEGEAFDIDAIVSRLTKSVEERIAPLTKHVQAMQERQAREAAVAAAGGESRLKHMLESAESMFPDEGARARVLSLLESTDTTEFGVRALEAQYQKMVGSGSIKPLEEGTPAGSPPVPSFKSANQMLDYKRKLIADGVDPDSDPSYQKAAIEYIKQSSTRGLGE